MLIDPTTWLRLLTKDNAIQNLVRNPSLSAYRRALARGGAPESAIMAAQAAYERGLRRLRLCGLLTASDLALAALEFNPERLSAHSALNRFHNETVADLADPGEVTIN